MASGSLLTKIHKACQEFIKLSLAPKADYVIHGAQATGCLADFRGAESRTGFLQAGQTEHDCQMLAIGTPADGFYALKTMKGKPADLLTTSPTTNPRLDQAIGGDGRHFCRTAGGVTVGVARKLIATGRIPHDDSAVLCITGHGLRRSTAVSGYVGQPREIKPSLREFEALVAGETPVMNA